MLNRETITTLIKIYKDDKKYLDIIERCISSFEEYHNRIFKLELWIKLYSNSSIDKELFKSKVGELDKARTIHHNGLLGNVSVLNKLAKINNLYPVYDGVISQDRPYRREVANSVLEYIEYVIKNRC